MAIVDLFMLYQFLRRLVQPFNKWDAYGTGVIDADGKVLVKPSNRSIAQKDSFGKFDLLVMRLKLLLGKIPGGKSRIASFAAAMMLIREQDDLHDIPDNMLQESLDIYINMMEDGGVPANVVGTGKIAGTDKPPVSRSYQKRIRRKRKDQANTLFIESKTDDKLENLFKVIGNELKGDYKMYVTGIMTKAVENAKKDIEGKKWSDVFGAYKKYSSQSPFSTILRKAYKHPEEITRLDGGKYQSSTPHSLLVLDKKRYKQMIEKEAQHATEMFYTSFVTKNAGKLSGILKDREVASLKHNLKGHNLTGTLIVELTNGSKFVMTFNVITKISKLGKWFNQFPTRFTSVKMEDGTMMRTPSEAKMKKEF